MSNNITKTVIFLKLSAIDLARKKVFPAHTDSPLQVVVHYRCCAGSACRERMKPDVNDLAPAGHKKARGDTGKLLLIILRINVVRRGLINQR